MNKNNFELVISVKYRRKDSVDFGADKVLIFEKCILLQPSMYNPCSVERRFRLDLASLISFFGHL